jgi:GT2 family glycosyltransferase
MKETETLKIAVLLACFNRKQKTLAFFDSLVNQHSFKKWSVDIFLLDDGSTDGTADAVKEKYPFVNVLTGTGNLFWAGGMRTIWKYAIAQKDYDLFCLFNDDVALFDNAFESLIKHYQKNNKNGTIMVGSTLEPKTGEMSYGGYILKNKNHSKYTSVKPDDNKSIPCDLANGNILLVDMITVKRIGVFLDAYTHFMADFDYTLTASRAGIDVLVSPGYYGYCEDDHGNSWMPGSTPLKERIRYLYSPKGLAYKEYLIYIKDKFPRDYFVSIIKLWMKTLLPIIWDKFKRRGY